MKRTQTTTKVRVVQRLAVGITVFAGVLGFSVNASAAASAEKQNCVKSARAVREIAQRFGLDEPRLRIRSVTKASYSAISHTITLSRCEPIGVIVHELGHWVHGRAAATGNTNFDAISEPFTKFPNWLRSTHDPYGYERLAHCVARELGARSVFARCPHKAAAALAQRVLEEARRETLASAMERRLAESAAVQAEVAAKYAEMGRTLGE